MSFEGFRGALYSSFTLGAHNFFLDQLRGVSLALSCQIPPKGNCSMWSYRFPNAIGFGLVVFGPPVITEIPRSDPCLGDGTVLKIALLVGIGSVHNTFRRGSENTS